MKKLFFSLVCLLFLLLNNSCLKGSDTISKISNHPWVVTNNVMLLGLVSMGDVYHFHDNGLLMVRSSNTKFKAEGQWNINYNDISILDVQEDISSSFIGGTYYITTIDATQLEITVKRGSFTYDLVFAPKE